MHTRPFLRAVVVSALVAGCSSMPERSPELDSAQASYQTAQSDPNVGRFAPVELRQATQAYDRAQAAWRDRADADRVAQLAYLSRQTSAIAIQAGRQRAAEEMITLANRDRDRVVLEARTREAARAEAAAADARQRAEIARASAGLSAAQAESARRQAEQAQQQAQQSQQQAVQSSQEAQAMRQSAEESRNRALALQQELDQLKAKQTNRGMVVSLGDVLFDTGDSHLKPGAQRTLDQLAKLLQDNPERRLSVEGFTDSVGNESYNERLSQSRADAVRAALLQRGVSPDRVTARGFGKAFPIASNDNAAGRQLNRRVEVVISDEHGTVSSR